MIYSFHTCLNCKFRSTKDLMSGECPLCSTYYRPEYCQIINDDWLWTYDYPSNKTTITELPEGKQTEYDYLVPLNKIIKMKAFL